MKQLLLTPFILCTLLLMVVVQSYAQPIDSLPPHRAVVQLLNDRPVKGKLVAVYDSSLLIVRGQNYFPVSYVELQSIRFRPEKRTSKGIIYGGVVGLITGILLFSPAGEDLDPPETVLLSSSLMPLGAGLGYLLNLKSPTDPEFKIKGALERWMGQKDLLIPYIVQNGHISQHYVK